MDVIWFAEIKWDYLKTRKQQLIARKPSDIRLLYLEPYVKGRPNRFSLRQEGEIRCATVPFVKSVPSGLARRALDFQLARYTLDRIAYSRIKRLVARLDFNERDLGLILSNIYAIRIASKFSRRFLLYDCNDAHASFPGLPVWSRVYFEEVCRKADGVYASSRALVRSVAEARGTTDGIEYLGNGVDFERFQADEAEKARPPKPGPMRFAYIGAIAPWVDFESFKALARRHPEWEIVLVGPVLHGAEQDLVDLTSLSNVSRLEAVPYETIPDVLRRFDAGLIPFRYSALTRGVNPNKLYEYLAAGLPVIATRFSEEVQLHPHVVRAAEPGEAFVTACEETVHALSDGPYNEMRDAAKRVAREYDWGNIADLFWNRVKKMMTNAS